MYYISTPLTNPFMLCCLTMMPFCVVRVGKADNNIIVNSFSSSKVIY